ncbi:uncharacterized protein LOC132699447 isoform X2 [Cylas formicarius]|uniref:uncharacterized protein LOC132699447 isoform X2 n=1 Tax=Cylas formicarius TaxID=197179 RepID=UPI002958AA72|nr:uncharacterized protein LOC132699447 isoform X2 [Cylas formicarius]
MGAVGSLLWETDVRSDDPDPVTGLTSKDRRFISSTWNKLNQNSAESGIAIFMALFMKYPNYQKLFPFRDIPRDELPKNKRFRAHCISLMYAFTAIVNNVGDTELLQELLSKQGVAHVPRGVQEMSYWLKEVLMELFGGSMTADELQSWNKFLDVGFSVIIQGARSVKPVE